MGNVKYGRLFYNSSVDRLDILFNPVIHETFGGLHCGGNIQCFINDEWVFARVEKGESGWYLAYKTEIDGEMKSKSIKDLYTLCSLEVRINI